jgi:predicted enzyme related to lactoylglutathione lyase
MNMITGLGGASIWSKDLNNLLPFYRDTLGMKVTIGTPEFALLGPEDEPALGIGTHSEVKGKASDPYRHMVGLNSSDLDADYKRLKDAGVEFIEAPTAYDDLRIATLKDPEGNIVQLFELPS